MFDFVQMSALESCKMLLYHHVQLINYIKTVKNTMQQLQKKSTFLLYSVFAFKFYLHRDFGWSKDHKLFTFLNPISWVTSSANNQQLDLWSENFPFPIVSGSYSLFLYLCRWRTWKIIYCLAQPEACIMSNIYFNVSFIYPCLQMDVWKQYKNVEQYLSKRRRSLTKHKDKFSNSVLQVRRASPLSPFLGVNYYRLFSNVFFYRVFLKIIHLQKCRRSADGR